MKMGEMAYRSVDHLAIANLRIDSCTVSAGHRFQMDSEPMERFIYITRGSVLFDLGDGSLQAEDGDTVYLPRETAYRSHWKKDSDFVVVDLLLSDARGRDIRFGDEPSILFRDTHGVYGSLFKTLAEKATENDPFNWLERTSLCLKILCEMARDTNRGGKEEKEERIKAALRYLEVNFARDTSVEELARMCYLSVPSFRRLFFECTGLSPVDFRNTLRIRRGAELLKSGKQSVSEVAELVGIGDVKYFGKLFKRYLGITPTAFKKERNP